MISSYLKSLAEGRNLIAYGRFKKENRLVVVLNTSEAPMWVELPVWEIGVGPEGEMKRLMLTKGDSYDSSWQVFSVKNGILALELPPESSIIFIEEK